MKNPTISPHVFNATIAKLRHHDGTASMRAAELILVGGLTQREAAREVGISVQTVCRAAKRVRKAILDEGMCPLCGRDSKGS
jgi:transposase